MFEKAIPRLRLMRQIKFSNVRGNRLIPGPGINAFFSRYSSAPSSINFSRFFSLRLLKTTTGIAAVDGSSFRCLRTSGPLILGRIMSSNTRSGFSFRAASSALSPSSAVITSYPERSKADSFSFRMGLLSSTKRIFTLFSLGAIMPIGTWAQFISETLACSTTLLCRSIRP